MNVGNAWNVQKDEDGVVRYLSDQWNRRVFGFEKREIDGMDIHLAQSHSIAMGHVAFGGGSMMVRRPWVNEFRYHARWHKDLFEMEGRLGADASAIAYLRIEDSRLRGMPTVFASNILFGSGTDADIADASPAMQRLEADLASMRDRTLSIDRHLFVDRIALALFEGEPAKTRFDALWGYGLCAQRIRALIVKVNRQSAMPAFVVSQSAGTADDGSSEVILAEGWLDVEYFSLQFVVATPKYHLPLEKGSASRLTPEAAAYVTEMEALAVDAKLQNRDWYCPHLTEANLAGREIEVRALVQKGAVLELDDPKNHGFTLEGDVGDCRIASVEVTGTDRLKIELTKRPKGDIRLCYAFGAKAARGHGLCANTGSLRDDWKQKALYDPSVTLRRYALATRLPVHTATAGAQS